MKNNILMLFAVLISNVAFSQNQTSGHLTFKGVPIDGTLAGYVAKMKQNGFTHISSESGLALLKGDFAGYKACTVGVTTLKDMDLVYKVVVVLPDKPTWSTLPGDYFNLKQMLTEKYGEPAEVTEEFQSAVQPEDDNSKMYEVKFDNCKFKSIWQTDKGQIQMAISHTDVSSCYVTLAYFDEINSEKIRKNAKDDL